jgi:hypothetical protein
VGVEGAGRFISSKRPVLLWSPYPGLKRPESKAAHSSSASDEVKSEWSFTFAPPYAFIRVTRVFHFYPRSTL